ncbi:hypothetical protein HMPREF1991_02746 [Hoylesella loescheii DSM 19665 = JCM 12249 = ATCC 15930]|uniref:Uncharacterized protein n=1 Tax=Hoylesella loescheii DSM 19665 = JCM 12249 = ATCC 15930 TaxID=1122985 RepID=A0A069QE88_HOYLO|nr:hypothetical protein HMPREF1991_02746 [Hoylesella loescheii DSM 19665 = JCM 12249 = ATCC 15930]
MPQYKVLVAPLQKACTDTTKGLYWHYKKIVARLQTACSSTTKGIVQTGCL